MNLLNHFLGFVDEVYAKPKTPTDFLRQSDFRKLTVEDLKKFKEEGADFNVKIKTTGATPLIRAAFVNRADLIEFLLEQNVDCNARDYDGSTALMIAAMNGSCEAIQALAKCKNINPNLQDNAGRTAYSYCLNAKTSDVLYYYFPFEF